MGYEFDKKFDFTKISRDPCMEEHILPLAGEGEMMPPSFREQAPSATTKRVKYYCNCIVKHTLLELNIA